MVQSSIDDLVSASFTAAYFAFLHCPVSDAESSFFSLIWASFGAASLDLGAHSPFRATFVHPHCALFVFNIRPVPPAQSSIDDLLPPNRFLRNQNSNFKRIPLSGNGTPRCDNDTKEVTLVIIIVMNRNSGPNNNNNNSNNNDNISLESRFASLVHHSLS
jgi:hypothetical protein